MKKWVFLIILLMISILVLLLPSVFATSISSCTAITESGTYTLTQDITSTGTCIEVQVSDVVLDCAGYKLTGSGIGYGILVQAVDRVTIKNCEVSGFEKGILLQGVNSSAAGNNVHDNSQYGFWIANVQEGDLTQNKAYKNSYGFYIESRGTFNNDYINNIAEYNVNGGFYVLGSDNTFVDNFVQRNDYGIWFDAAATGNTVDLNRFCFNGLTDIRDDDSNTGSSNACDKVVNWNDAGTTGCLYSCNVNVFLVGDHQVDPSAPEVNGTDPTPVIEGGPVKPSSAVGMMVMKPGRKKIDSVPGSVSFGATPYSATPFAGSFNDTFDSYANANEAIWGCGAEGAGAPTTAGCGLGVAPGAEVGDKALSFDTRVLGPSYEIIFTEARIIFPYQDFEMEGVFYVDSATVPLDEGLVMGARLIDESTMIFADWDNSSLVLKKESFPDLASAPIPLPENTWVKVKLVFSAGRVKFFYATGLDKATISLPSTPTFNVEANLRGPFSFILGLHGSSTGMSGLVYWDDFLTTAVPNTGSVLLNAPAISVDGVDYNEFNQIIATGQGSFLTNPACQHHPKFYLLPAVVDCLDLNKDLHAHATVADLGVPIRLTVYSNGLTTASSEEALFNVFNLLELLKFAGIATDYSVDAQGLFAKSVDGTLTAVPTPADADGLKKIGSTTGKEDGTFRIKVTEPLEPGPNILFAVEGFEGQARISKRVTYNLLLEEDTDGDGILDVDDECPGDYGYLEFAGCCAAIEAQADKHTVGTGSHPGATKEPLVGLTVGIYDKSETSCARTVCGGISWQHYACIVTNCQTIDRDHDGYGDAVDVTDGNGMVSINLMAGDYLVIGDDGTDKHLGVSASDLLCDTSMKKHLQQLIKADGEKLPGKSKKVKGSEILIVEPEYIIWDSTEETYPFIFESMDSWGVDVIVAPPAGYVSDYSSLTETTPEYKAVQFTLTEVGSVPDDVGVRMNLRGPNGKSHIHRSQIGTRLTANLAKAKGVAIDKNGVIIGKGKAKGITGMVVAEEGEDKDASSTMPGVVALVAIIALVVVALSAFDKLSAVAGRSRITKARKKKSRRK